MHEYDGLGRHVLSRTKQGSAGTEVTLEKSLDHAGNTDVQYLAHHGSASSYITYERDSAGRTTGQEVVSASATHSTDWDFNGSDLTVTDPNGITTLHELDGLGNIAKTTATVGSHLSGIHFGVATDYTNGPVQAVDIQDASGATSWTQYRWLDDGGRSWRVQDHQSGTGGYTVTTTDATGDVACVTDPAGNAVVYEADFAGRQTAVYHDTSCTPTTDPVTEATYDGNLPASIPAGPGFSSANATGRLSGSTDEAGGRALSYDSQGRVADELRWWDTSGPAPFFAELSYSHDNEGNPDSLTLQWRGGSTISVQKQFGPGGVVEDISLSGVLLNTGSTPAPISQTVMSSASYHPNGAYDTLVFGNGVTQTLGLDDLGRPDLLTTSGASTDLDLDDFDGANNITSITDAGGTDEYAYDDAYRLTGVVYGDTGDTLAYTYDDFHNMTDLGGTEATRLGIDFAGRSFTYNLETTGDLSYDARGCMATTPDLSLTTDAAGDLITLDDGSVTQEIYRDAQGNPALVQRHGSVGTATSFLLHDASGRVLARFSRSGGRVELTWMLVYLGDLPVAAVVQGATGLEVLWMHNDIHGSTRLMTDSGATTQLELEFTPFGTTRSATVGSPKARLAARWAGHDAPDSLDSVNMGSRHMLPGLPGMVRADMVALGDLANPVSMNRWAYAYQNPMAWTDPTGDIGFLAAFAIAWVAVEVALTVADTVAFASTAHAYANGQASGRDVLLSGGLLAVGIAAPAGGYAAAVRGLNKIRAANMVRRMESAAKVSKYVQGGRAWGSFGSAKKALGTRAGHDWHHIVEQGQTRAKNAWQTAVHNENNLVSLPKAVHGKISGYSSRARMPWTQGRRVRLELSAAGLMNWPETLSSRD